MRLLAVASKGGHWVQLMRLVDAFEGHVCRYVSTDPTIPVHYRLQKYHCIKDGNRRNLWGLAFAFAQLAIIVARFRPEVVITTGAAPGLSAIILGRLAGARTIWIDSIANAEELSLSGRKAQRWADVWLTQWPELAKSDGPQFEGRVI